MNKATKNKEFGQQDWEALRHWMEQDDEGRAVLERFQEDPNRRAAVSDWVRAHADEAPNRLSNVVHGGAFEKFVNVASAEQIVLSSSPQGERQVSRVETFFNLSTSMARLLTALAVLGFVVVIALGILFLDAGDGPDEPIVVEPFVEEPLVDPIVDGYGDDPYLDALWEGCDAGYVDDCWTLYADSPPASSYEADAESVLILLGEM